MQRTLEQNKRIWALVNRIAELTGKGREFAEELMRLDCKETSGQEHTFCLSGTQASNLIKRLQRRVEILEEKEKTSNYYDPEAPVTGKQLRAIDGLYKTLGWMTEAQQIGFSSRIIKKDRPETRADGVKIHQALQAMILQRHSPEDLSAKCSLMLNVRAHLLTEWEKAFLKDVDSQISEGGKLSSMKVVKILEIWEKVKES